ncbi:MAG TPA: hypothetical protein VGR26_18855 [Acidimicrobiales bacterium]|nr:hypothetical protein [Acidimicrobiales bacterium]
MWQPLACRAHRESSTRRLSTATSCQALPHAGAGGARYRRLDKARSRYRRTIEFVIVIAVAVALAGLVGAVLSVHALLADQARTSPPSPSTTLG